jgi:cytochrome c oxidase cbb3-type subunit 4
MTYDLVARFAQQAGTVYFLLIFAGGAAYALWPKNKEGFARAARLPLEEEEL